MALYGSKVALYVSEGALYGYYGPSINTPTFYKYGQIMSQQMALGTYNDI